MIRKLGKGGSIKVAALASASKEIVVYMDIDLSADPSKSTLSNYIHDYDIVIGSRIMRGRLPGVKGPLYMTLLSLAYSKFFRFLFRILIYDPQCGFKMFRREVILLLFSEIGIDGFAFDPEVIVRASSHGYRIKEVPINWRHGKFSTLSVIREITSMGSDILSVWYDFHLSWKNNGKTYSQKKGSIFRQLLFSLLSRSSDIREKYSRYLQNKISTPTLLTSKPDSSLVSLKFF